MKFPLPLMLEILMKFTDEIPSSLDIGNACQILFKAKEKYFNVLLMI